MTDGFVEYHMGAGGPGRCRPSGQPVLDWDGSALFAVDGAAGPRRRREGGEQFLKEVSRMKKVALIMGSDSDWPQVKSACAGK